MNLKRNYIQLWKNHLCLSLSIHCIVFIFLFSDFIIGSKPVFCSYKNEWYSFLWNGKPKGNGTLFYDLNEIAAGDFQKLHYDFVWWPLLIRNAQKLEPESAWLNPGLHSKDGTLFILGSYDLGKDLLVACIIGFKKSLSLALLTLLFSLLPALSLGSLVMFHSVRYQQISLGSVILFSISGILLVYAIAICFEWMLIPNQIYPLLFIVVVLFSLAIGIRNSKPMVRYVLDAWSLRYLEIMKSIPVLLILLILLQILTQPNRIQFAGMLAFIFIPYLLKYARAFTLKAASENFITASIAMGQSGWQVYTKHVLPKIMQALIPVMAFGLANIILLEASLSFIGIGLGVDEISLGGLLYSARSNPSAWWVIVFPGLLIFWLVILFNQIGTLFSKELIEPTN